MALPISGHRALPDQLVEPILIPGQVLLYSIRFAKDRCGADRFVGFLGPFGLFLVDRRLTGEVFVSIPLGDILARLCLGLG